MIIYLLLQIAFYYGLDACQSIAGWSHLQLPGRQPVSRHSASTSVTLFVTGIICRRYYRPVSCGFNVYRAAPARSLYAQSKNDYLPLFLQKLNSHGHPIYAIIVNFVVGMCLFAPLPGWNKMISFLTSLMAITYAIAPISLLSLRKQLPDYPRPFRLPLAKVLGFLAFYFCTLMSYWSGWEVISKLSIAFIAGMIVLFGYHFTTSRGRQLQFHWRESIWIWPYFLGLSVISYLGSFGHGLGWISFGWDFLIIGIFCLIVLALAQHFILPSELTKHYIAKLQLEEPVH